MLDDRIPNAVTISIPRNWTTAQADAVFDFLCRLEEAVFIAYEPSLLHGRTGIRSEKSS